MGEMTNKSEPARLTFRPAGLTSREANEGATAYAAEAAGVKYRVVGTIVDPMRSARRTFRAYRVVGESGHTLHPAAGGGAHKTRAAAFAQAETDLADVLRDRAAEGQHFESVPEREERLAVADADTLLARATARTGTEGAVHLRGTHSVTLVERAAGRTIRVEEPEVEIAGVDDRLSMVITPSGMRKIAAHLAARNPTPEPTDPATDDSVSDLVDRVVRRSQYVALTTMRRVLAGWVEGAASNHEALDHRSPLDECCHRFAPADIAVMINDAADELRVPKVVGRDAE
jgi:hypothetical protein